MNLVSQNVTKIAKFNVLSIYQFTKHKPISFKNSENRVSWTQPIISVSSVSSVSFLIIIESSHQNNQMPAVSHFQTKQCKQSSVYFLLQLGIDKGKKRRRKKRLNNILLNV